MDAPDPESDRESESRWGGRGGDWEAEPGLVIWGGKEAGPGHSEPQHRASGVVRGRDPEDDCW